MKVLIIGGTGLISTAITRELLERGEDVTLYNRGQRELWIAGNPHRIIGDRNDFPTFERQMAGAGAFDCVIDMVCFAPEQAESAIRAFKGRVGQFIFCSTVDVYSKPPSGFPIREDEPRRSISDYGRMKVRCEDLLMEAHARADFPVTIIRPSHTYGEGGSIVHTFGWSTTYIDRIRKGKPIVVHGDGRSLWVSCHIDDVGHAFVMAIGNPKALGRAYNAAGDDARDWNQYHQGVAEALGAPPPQLVHIPTDLLARFAARRADITIANFQYSNLFDNSAAREDLDFHPKVGWIDGVRRTVAWLDERGMVKNSDDDPFDDRVIAAWERLSAAMVEELRGVDD